MGIILLLAGNPVEGGALVTAAVTVSQILFNGTEQVFVYQPEAASKQISNRLLRQTFMEAQLYQKVKIRVQG